jgi:hypothetical protein
MTNLIKRWFNATENACKFKKTQKGPGRFRNTTQEKPIEIIRKSGLKTSERL